MTPTLARVLAGRTLPPTVVEREPPPPPPWDLSMVDLPPWFWPLLLDTIALAERTFGPDSGDYKQDFVQTAVLRVLEIHPCSDLDDLGPPEVRSPLLAILIRGLCELYFPRSGEHHGAGQAPT